MRRLMSTALGVGLLGLLCGYAIPETVVFMPTATLNSPRSVYLATEQFGTPRYYNETRTRCLYTQLMLTERFDFGLDFIGVDKPSTRQEVMNARWVVNPENKRLPGFSVGVLNVGENLAPIYYGVSSRTTSVGRFSLGSYQQRGEWGWSAAWQASFAGFDFAVEHFRFPDTTTYTSFGLGRSLNDTVYLYTYYSRHDKTRDADLFGVYFAFTPFRLF
ncbi:MAG: hypothetical protein SNJ72_05330 [Fimbriimonadales bacterium]